MVEDAKKEELLTEEVKPLKLNLGSGEIRIDGFTNVDISPDCKPDIVHDLTSFPYPFEDSSVDEIFCSHFFEHLTGAQRISFMEECYRMLKPASGIKIIVPYYANMRAIQDPTHQWPPVSETSFLYFNKKWMEDNKLTHYGIKCDFNYSYGFDDEGETRTKNLEVAGHWRKHYINAVNDLHVTLVKK